MLNTSWPLKSIILETRSCTTYLWPNFSSMACEAPSYTGSQATSWTDISTLSWMVHFLTGCLPGVSKGSILGPLFFLAYENNMPTVIFSIGLALDIALFADNSKLFLLTHDQSVLPSLCRWTWTVYTTRALIVACSSTLPSAKSYIMTNKRSWRGLQHTATSIHLVFGLLTNQ